MTSDFTYTPLGPWTDADGDWCCGLHCARPCPYGLKLKPRPGHRVADPGAAPAGSPSPDPEAAPA